MLNGAEVTRRREALGKSQADLAREAGVSQPVINEIEKGKQQTTKKLPAIARALGCSPRDLDPDWGVVESDGSESGDPSGRGIREISANGGLGGGQTPPIAYAAHGSEVQIVDSFKPQPWIFPDRIIREGFGVSAEKIIAVATSGDSMHPTISHGSVVFVDTRDTRIKPQELYALRDVYGEIIVKRLDVFKRDSEWWVRIQSDNPATKARDEPLDEVTIIGRVKGIFRLL